jgi:hypothetical protein
MPEVGDLCVWHIPQVPGKPFYVPVKTVAEAKLVDRILCAYDLFEFDHRIKPDFCNAGGLNVWDGDVWMTWYGEEGEDFDDYEVKDAER